MSDAAQDRPQEEEHPQDEEVSKVELKPLTRRDILRADDLSIEVMEVPEWGGTVRARELTGKQREAFEFACNNKKTPDGKLADTRGLRVLLLGMALVDENDELAFTGEHLEQLADKSSKVLDRLFLDIQKMNVIDDDSQKELEKNSQGDQNDNSGSDSPDS